MMEAVLILLLLFPITGGLVNGAIGMRLPRRASEGLACAAILLSLGAATAGFAMQGEKVYNLGFYDWFSFGDFSVIVNVHYDRLAAIMALMVTFVSSIIHLYSVSFMRKDADYVRYFCYLNLFVFSMLVIVLADNLLFLFLGWEGVGFCSYALIGFWYTDEEKATAGRKAFIVTRIADVAFLVAVALFFSIFGNFSISYIVDHVAVLSGGTATLLGLLLLATAVGKSAQLPLTVWLPDAMAGPTPVSALIHAATMVTAGVYLLMRLFPVLSLSPTALTVISLVAAITAFYSACSALGQRDIKRVLAYSTISQVAYMFLGVGAGDIAGGLFLLISHAFFKSLLFLAAGCVIQALDEEHDIYKMGNLRQRMPYVYWLFLAGALSLSAVPPVGGYFSKDRILTATFIHPEPVYKVIWAIAFVGALLTTLYTMRLFFIAFPNRPGGRREGEVQPVPKFMPLVITPLAFCALFDGVLNLPFGPVGRWLARYLLNVPGVVVDIGASTYTEAVMSALDGGLVVVIVGLAYLLYRRPEKAPEMRGIREFLFSGFYLDRLYGLVFAAPYKRLGQILWQRADEGGIDRGIEGYGKLFLVSSGGIRLWTNGRLSTYLKMLLIWVAGVLCFLAASFWYA